MPESEVPLTPGERVAAGYATPFLSAVATLEERLGNTLVGTLREGLERHQAVIAEIGLAGPAPAESSDRSDKLLEYRQAVGKELVEATMTALEKGGPASWVEVAAAETLRESVSSCSDLPMTCVEPWHEDALDRRTTDQFGRRVGKALGRIVSSARKAGREREIPLRAVALRHLESEVVPRLDGWAKESMEMWADWSGRLDRAWADWCDSALPLLIRTDQPQADTETAEDHWSAIHEASSRLDSALASLVNEAPVRATATAGQAWLGEARAVLEADMAVAGSFLFRPNEKQGHTPHLGGMTKVLPGLKAWDEGLVSRLRLCAALLAILAGATAVQRRMVWRFREHCLGQISELIDIAAELEGLKSSVRPSGGPQALAANLTALEASVRQTLEPALDKLPERSLVDSTVSDGSDATIQALLSMVRQAPTQLVLHADGEHRAGRRRRLAARPLALQELANQSFDALRIERIRSSTAGLIEAVDEVRINLTELPQVFAFAYEAALAEIEDGVEDAEARAERLVTEALQNTADSLRGETRKLDEAVVQAQDRLASEISDGSLGLLERVAAGNLQARVLEARSRIADASAWLGERAGPPLRRAQHVARRWWAHIRRLARIGLRKGSAIVGSGPTDGAASRRSLKTLSDPTRVTERLPLVYQRLFTLGPLTDPALLGGRSGELSEALERWRGWQAGDGVPLIVKGRQGSGVTSFMNVLGASISEDGTSLTRVTLEERVTSEAALAQVLSPALGLAPADSLDDLASAILGADELPKAVTLDNLEHLYLRVPEGTNLIERFLTLMAETEPRIFWIAGVTTSAWQLVAAAEPTAVSQVDVLDLHPLDKGSIRDAISVRHRRSGLALRFLEPETSSSILKGRLRRKRSREEIQELLAEDFYDRLHRASSGQLGLALFQWVLSADFETGDGLAMRFPEKPDLTLLDALDLTQNFTLKAFLEHRSLTLEEHDRIFRLPRHESYQIFESLDKRHLIQAVAPSGRPNPGQSEIVEGLRYSLRPLLSGAVIGHLGARNIVH